MEPGPGAGITTGVHRSRPWPSVQPESLYDRFIGLPRESLGMEVLALTGGPRPPF
jgi:hypothetical protein